MTKTYTSLQLLCLVCLFLAVHVSAQVPQPVKQFGRGNTMKGASYAVVIKDVNSGESLVSFDSDRLLTPASVLKSLTTATALEMLGPDFRYETQILYSGTIGDGVLKGDLYIKGSGDPTLGSSFLSAAKDSVLACWVEALKNKGIHTIQGRVIADERIFDNEGIAAKWLREDIGNYFGAGSYGLSVFDNRYELSLRSGAVGSRPEVIAVSPDIPDIRFDNQLRTVDARTDSVYIFGAPFSHYRALYGAVPPHRKRIAVKGDIPDPALFLAQYFSRMLTRQGISIAEKPTSYRLLLQNEGGEQAKNILVKTYSPPLVEIIRITNFVSHNLYADALLKTLGALNYKGAQNKLSSFGKGIEVMKHFWMSKGIDVSAEFIHDGSGLSPTNKVTASMLADVYTYMATRSAYAEDFRHSLPVAGKDGTLRRFLGGSKLQGSARLKSGSMTAVSGFGGYLEQNDKTYAVVVLVNQFSGKTSEINRRIEQMLLSLF